MRSNEPSFSVVAATRPSRVKSREVGSVGSRHTVNRTSRVASSDDAFSEKSRLFRSPNRSVRRAPWRQRCTRSARRTPRCARRTPRFAPMPARPVGFVAARAGRLGRFPAPRFADVGERGRRRRAERRGPRAIRQAHLSARLRRGEAGVPRARARAHRGRGRSRLARVPVPRRRGRRVPHPRGRRRRGAEQPAPANRARRRARAGASKALSAATAIAALNPRTNVRTHLEGVTQKNALALVKDADVVLDCTDNPRARYLLSDACASLKKPLVSAAAVGTEGQLTVYVSDRAETARHVRHVRATNASDTEPIPDPDDATNATTPDRLLPCYRCVFPTPPRRATSGTARRAGFWVPSRASWGRSRRSKL